MKSVYLFLFFGHFILSCNSPDEKSKNPVVKNDYPTYVVRGFIEGCLEDNPNPDITQTLICSCLMERIQSKYTIDEYFELSKEQQGSKWDDYQIFLNKAAEACINKTNK